MKLHTCVDKSIALTLLLLSFLAITADAQENNRPEGIDFKGFLDLQYNDSARVFQWGQLELDFLRKINESVTVEGAIAYNPELESFGIGAAFVDFTLFACKSNFCLITRFFDRAGIIAGQFYLPFGIDWKVYSSIDRKLVTAPLAVEETHGAWNDAGIMFYAEQRYVNLVLYQANFENPNSLDIITRRLSGGRIGITPFEGIEIGGSFARDFRDKRNSRSDAFRAGR